MAKTRFSFRAFTSLILFWMFAALLVSGIVLFIAPPGRIAHWTEWRMLALTKEQWQSIHTLSSLTFLIGGLFHFLKFNRHVIWTYVKRSRQAGTPFRGVVVASAMVSALVIVGTAAGWPPFSLVMGVGEGATESWATAEASPPLPHAEELSLTQIVERLGLDLSTARSALAEAGVQTDGPEQSLRDIARANDLAPAYVYALLQLAAPTRPEVGVQHKALPMGLGRMTIEQVSSQEEIGASSAVERLRAAGINADPDESLRRVAQRHGTTPIDVYNLLTQSDEAR